MNVNLEFRWADPDDLAEIQEFLSHTYGPDSIQALPGRCRWLYFENPLGLHVSLCRASGTIVAVCGHLPQTVRVGGREILAGFGIDFMVAPPWRRKGIGRRFLEMRLERFALCLSIGQSDEMSTLYRSVEACDLGPFHMGYFRRRPAIAGGIKSTIRNWAIWGQGHRGVRPSHDTSLKPCGFPIATAYSTDRYANGDTAGNSSSFPPAQWLVWRFESTIYQDYICLEIKDGERITGYAVCREDDRGIHLIQLLCSHSDRAKVLAALARLLPFSETRILYHGNDMHQACRKAGYLSRPHGARLVAMTADPELQSTLVPGVIDLSAGAADADLLRFLQDDGK
jgi:GNAT superfamily N-acetyltransferase